MTTLNKIDQFQRYEYAEDLAQYLFDEQPVYTAVSNSGDNDIFTRPDNGAMWTVFVYASVKVANDLISAVEDGVFVGYSVVCKMASDGNKKVWLSGGKLSQETCTTA